MYKCSKHSLVVENRRERIDMKEKKGEKWRIKGKHGHDVGRKRKKSIKHEENLVRP